MSASRQFQNLQNNPLNRSSRQKGGIMGMFLGAEKSSPAAPGTNGGGEDEDEYSSDSDELRVTEPDGFD
jgi:hypothetical protein